MESDNEVKNLRNNLKIKIKELYANLSKKYNIDAPSNDFEIEYINEIIIFCLMKLIMNILDNKIDINYLNILNETDIVNNLLKNKELKKINIFISNFSIKIFNVFNLFLKNNSLNISLNIKKKEFIKNINNLLLNFLKNELYLIIKNLKKANYFTNEHYILKIKTLMQELINKSKEDNLDLLVNSIFFEFKSTIDTDNFYDYEKKNEYMKEFFKNIFDKINDLTFEERFFYNSYVNLSNKISNTSSNRINLKK